MTPEDIRAYLNIALIPVIVAIVWGLAVVLCREWVKTDLRSRGFTPRRVRWRFFSSSRIACSFNVRYLDRDGLVHKAQCWTYWHRRSVTWESDERMGSEIPGSA